MVPHELWQVVAVAVGAVGNSLPDDPTTIIQELLEPHRVLLDRAKAAVTELVEAAVEAANLVALAAVQLVVTMVHFPVKMATVWHPEAVLYPAVHMVVEVE
jgi:hypothetical protein